MKLTESISKLFRRKHKVTSPKEGVREGTVPLRIEGIDDAPLTPEPDEAELAAQAVLEMMVAQQSHQTHQTHESHQSHESQHHDVRYYQDLASRIRQAHEAARQRTMRFLAYCEQTLSQPGVPVTGSNSLQLIERELYKRIDIVEREGGELKRRWQHCLADVTVRLMKAEGGLEDNHDNKEQQS